MFKNLKNLLVAENEKEKETTRFYIENGYCNTWGDEHKKPNDDGIKSYSTSLRWDQYQEGKISRDKAVELATARREKELNKRLAAQLEKLENVAAAPDLISVTIDVEWKRNPTWGYNPTATITTHARGEYKRFIGTASGCGYDKRTAAIGSALNNSLSVLKMLYTKKENALNNPPEKGRFDGVSFDDPITNHSLIHYGAGYGVLPYFEGGVGISSFYGVFEACGFKCTSQHETRTTDYYYFEKMEA